MATTRFFAMHIGKGKTLAGALSDGTSYGKNPAKTNDGKYISAYECDHATVDKEWLLAKRQYAHITGRRQKRDVIVYQIRQSFKPGEVTPEDANRIGYETAMRFTKGAHAFIVATHVDKEHVHSHIYFNSTKLDCTGKFRDFFRSGQAVRKLSDQLCLENGLSVVEHPKHRRGKHYGQWLGDKHEPSAQEKLRIAIDVVLQKKPKNFDTFLEMMQAEGYTAKRGKLVKFLVPGQKYYTKLRALGEGYSEQDLQEIIGGKQPLSPERAKRKPQAHKVNLLVDIEAKLLAGKGRGYENWAKSFNLKQAAQTLNYLSENKLMDYGKLEQKAAEASERFNKLNGTIRRCEAKMAEIAELKTHIFNYSKTRDTYTAYRKAGYSKSFKEAHRADILLHQAAKRAFDALPDKRIPSVKRLQSEYVALLEEKKAAHSEYKRAKAEMQDILTAKANVDRLLEIEQRQPEQENERQTR